MAHTLVDLHSSNLTFATITDVVLPESNVNTTHPHFQECWSVKPNMEEFFSRLPFWSISFVGIIGNLLVILVYLKKNQKTPGDIPILMLAYVDFFMCVFSILFTLMSVLFQPNTRVVGCMLPLCIIGNISFDATYSFSCAMMCVMSINRFLAVCRPHSYHSRFAVRKQILVYFALSFGSVPFCYFGVWSCLSAPDNYAAKTGWVLQRILIVLVTISFMLTCYSNVIKNMYETKRRIELHMSNIGIGNQPVPTLPNAKTSKLPLSSCAMSTAQTCLSEDPEERNPILSSRTGEGDRIVKHYEHSLNGNSIGEADMEAGTSINVSAEVNTVPDSHLLCNQRLSLPKKSFDAERTEGSKNDLSVEHEGSEISEKLDDIEDPDKLSSALYTIRRFVRRLGKMNYEKKLTVLFISVGCVFLLLTIPDVILQTADILHAESEQWAHTFESVHKFCQSFFLLNFTINPIIYYIMNSYFRCKVLKMIRLKRD